MATTPLFLKRSDMLRFEATVTDQDGDTVLLDRTAFYPTGGGQPHDTGKLVSDKRSWEVSAVKGRDEIWHTVESDPPSIGTELTGVIHSDRRHAHMRYHTAQHILSAVLLDEFDAQTTGNQLYATRARIDCGYERFEDADLQAIEDEVNAHIVADQPVICYEMSRTRAEAELDPTRTRLDLLPPTVDPVRIVEIASVDQTACAGTHVSRTGVIGQVRITDRETAGRGEERIRFVLEADGTS